jgi:hypothetical protein
LHVFTEPDSPKIGGLADIIVHHNDIHFGCVGNWTHCLRWLLNETDAEFLLVSEDDVAYCRGARQVIRALHVQ